MSRKKPRRRSTGKSYKDLRLCGQIAKALNYALAGECDDDILRDLYVDSVIPSPNSSRLLVTVMPNSLPSSSAEILERLQLNMNILLSEIASSINRRKVPQLKFNVIGKYNLDENPIDDDYSLDQF
ncbi:hypothetical protein [Candidatus Uabimicrobium sp. HlEnr_7]|uniref:hypothetical protein n=1 Tax=Candidatus Uabimicrobium helgolandensis TaxID=3095367 RepID=UPI0035586DA8